MKMPRIIFRAFTLGFIIEAAALLLSFGLYALKQGREPMEPPFNLAATIIQMPGIFVSECLADASGIYTGWVRWSVVFCVQAVMWAFVCFAFLLWRTRGRKS
jgi:hypothetical protein